MLQQFKLPCSSTLKTLNEEGTKKMRDIAILSGIGICQFNDGVR